MRREPKRHNSEPPRQDGPSSREADTRKTRQFTPPKLKKGTTQHICKQQGGNNSSILLVTGGFQTRSCPAPDPADPALRISYVRPPEAWWIRTLSVALLMSSLSSSFSFWTCKVSRDNLVMNWHRSVPDTDYTHQNLLSSSVC